MKDNMNFVGPKLLILVIFVVISQGHQTEFNNRKYDEPSRRTNNLNLSGKNWKRISKEVSKEIKVLELNNVSITNIEFGDFQDFPSLEILNLESNNLASISPGSFKELRYLQVLNLRNNRLRDLRAHLFDGLFRLRFLDLGNNPVVRLDVSVFESLMQLESLRLDGCNLVSFHMASVTNLLFLDNLDLSRNYLTTLQVPKSQRSYPPSLRILKLSENPWNCDCRMQNVMNQLNSLEYVTWHFDDDTPICCEPFQFARLQWIDLPIDSNIPCSSNPSTVKNSEEIKSLIQKSFVCFKPEILQIDSEINPNSSITDLEQIPLNALNNNETILSIVITAIILLELAVILGLVIFAIRIYRRNHSTEGYISIIT